ncbi:ATP-binding cassette domain-containing protein [Patescibacteria group bacterium]|nr:ATP-binding cassette domain-containing protein [Patescibacteria group bacterium]MBU4023270.1 ATP-binding cassette domain-containing protein [Patescibacteria group bacterium]MBU4078373.1 ATP-binding cassette domain-containing protein [Patescibacteria group bacterium]
MIVFENISKIYPPDSVALENISFRVGKGEFVSIVGKSGAGKSTLIKLLLREEEPSQGKIYFDDYDILDIKISHLPYYRQRIGAVFQDYRLLNNKTVYENVAYAMEVMGGTDYEIQRDVPQLLGIVGLEDKFGNFPREISGGEKQRTAIARALAMRPDVIVADEPTGNLDPYHSKEIIDLLEKINEMGTTVILCTHDKEVINSLKRRVITFDQGELVRDEEKGRFIL